MGNYPLKKLFVFIVFVTLLASVSGASGNEFPRHVDPMLVLVSNPDPVKLVELYSNIFGYVSEGKYDAALDLVDTVDNLIVSLDAKNVLNDYNELIRTMIYEISQTDFNVETALNELYWLRETEAYNALLKAYPHIEQANITTLEIMRKSSELANVLSIDPRSLLNETKKNEETVDYFDLLIQQVLVEIEVIAQKKLEGLSETSISIDLNNVSRFVGEEIIVSGILKAEDVLLDSKIVKITIADSSVSTITNAVGSYNISLTIPYLYKNTINVEARYSPSVQDIDLYTPTRNSLYFEPKYFLPYFTLTYPPTVFPGKDYAINGIISVEPQRIGNVSIMIEGFGSSAIVVSDRAGAFSSRIVIPDDQEVGLERLRVSSVGSGIIGPQSADYLINVEKLVTYIEYQKPSLLLSGLETIISGTVSSTNSSLANCQVILKFDDREFTEITNDEGNYAFTVSESWFALSAIKQLTLTAIPNEPWIASQVAKDSIIVFNLAFTMPPILFVALALYRNRPITPTLTPSIELDEPKPEPVVYPHSSGLSGIYIRAVKIISRITGQDLFPSNTIREYIRNVAPFLSRRSYQLFYQITRLFERWFYGRKKDRPPLRTTNTLVKRLEDEESST